LRWTRATDSKLASTSSCCARTDVGMRRFAKSYSIRAGRTSRSPGCFRARRPRPQRHHHRPHHRPPHDRRQPRPRLPLAVHSPVAGPTERARAGPPGDQAPAHRRDGASLSPTSQPTERASPATGGTISRGQEVDLADHLVAGKITIFDFYSDYCPPCRTISPKLEELAGRRDDIAVVKVDINRSGVRGID